MRLKKNGVISHVFKSLEGYRKERQFFKGAFKTARKAAAGA
jgi:hypothetical protein